MDSPWCDDDGHSAPHEAWNGSREAEWAKMSSEFINVGYREGIVAGKEASAQEGFNAGFALVGAPLGRELGLLRGRASAVLAFLNALVQSNSVPTQLEDFPALLVEAREINVQLGDIRFSDIEPPDEEAKRHAKEHLETEGEEMEGTENVEERRIEGVVDMLARWGIGQTEKKVRPTLEDVGSLRQRLSALCVRMGLSE